MVPLWPLPVRFSCKEILALQTPFPLFCRRHVMNKLSVAVLLGTWWFAGCMACAGVITVSSAVPTIDGADIANLANPGPGAGAFDPGGNEGHIWSNRPI